MDAEQISRLFAAPVSTCVATPQMYDADLFPQEAEAIVGAVTGRRREFAAGRACARVALGGLGAVADPILVGPGRAPVWPGGYVGSISHCIGFCGAVVASASLVRGIGFDAEGAEPLTAEMARLICRPDEVEHFATSPEPSGSSWSKLAFSAKEAFYKCYYPLTRTVLDFGDVSVRFSTRTGCAEGGFQIALVRPDRPLHSLQKAFRGSWRVTNGRIYSGVTLFC